MTLWKAFLTAIVVFFIIQALRFIHMQSKLPLVERERILGRNQPQLPAWRRQWIVDRYVAPSTPVSAYWLIAVVVVFFVLMYLAIF